MAKNQRKRVLLEFGANWNDPCRQFHALCCTNTSVANELDKHYVVVLVDVNNGHNATLEKKYGHPIHSGLPAIAVLDANGKKLTTENPKQIPDAGDFSPEKTVSFLQQWAPNKADSR